MSSRMVNTKYNLYTSVIYQAVSAIINIVVRKIFLVHFGLFFLSLDGYFSNIITMLNLLDLGIGTSSMYFLAKAYASKDDEEIYITYIAYKKLYYILAIIITIFGLIVCYNIAMLVNIDGYDLNYIRLIFLLTLSRTIAFYLLSTARNTLQFSQRNYVNMIINIIAVIFFSAIRIISIFLFENYLLYVLLLLAEVVFTFFASNFYFKKYIVKVSYTKEIVKEKIKEILRYGKKLIVVNINSFIFNSTDNLIINEILGLNYVGLMSNYYMIINSITLFANQILESAHASIYNFLNDKNSNDIDNSIRLLYTLNFISFIIASFCGICLFGLTDEFISIMYGNEYVLNKSVILLFVLNLIILMFQSPLTAYSNGLGLVKFEIAYSTIMAIVNLTFSIILGYKIGIQGVLLGTLLANLIMTFGKMNIIFKNYDISIKNYLLTITKYISIIIFNLGIIYFIFPKQCNNFVDFIIRGIMCCLLFVGCILLFYKNSEFEKVKQIALNFMRVRGRYEKEN